MMIMLYSTHFIKSLFHNLVFFTIEGISIVEIIQHKVSMLWLKPLTIIFLKSLAHILVKFRYLEIN